ncbi:MAG: hypothetical protein ABI614_16780, partial [Planctomycetota bacterium]
WYIGKTWLGQIIGLADSEQTLVRHGDLCGYLAPEILAWQSPPTLAADVYGIGAILFGYLAGMAPVDPFPTHHMQNKLIDAYESLDAALELDPGNPIVHHTRAEIFFLQGEPKWALKENERALSVDDSGTVHFLHGQCLVALADYANAERHLRQGLQKEESSRGRHVLASCLERAGQTKMAMLGRTE